MTAIWGPLGWMTLHSVSFNYPDTPSREEKIIASRFLDLFGETISCNECKVHFKTLRALYVKVYPDYLDSKQNFAYFVFRCHNMVNKRKDKPTPSTVSACLDALKNAVSITSFANFRASYIAYLIRNWGRDITGDGRITQGYVKEMIKINNEYWSLRETAIPSLPETDVLVSLEKSKLRIAPSGAVVSTSVGFKGGRLKLTRR
jgi:hypothetical protein